jgi:uncharacterized protein (DUF1015 family)
VAASRVRNQRRGNNQNHTGEEPYNYFLTVIFPDSQLQILDYNRVAKDLNGMNTETFLSRLEENFEVKPYPFDNPYKPEQSKHFGMYLNHRWYHLTVREGTYNPSDPIEDLDVAILQNNLLSHILDMQDPRTEKRLHFVGGIRGLDELERLVDSGKYTVAFSLYPTRIDQLMAVADAGKVMPPKSTWFEPKLGSGLFVYMLD